MDSFWRMKKVTEDRKQEKQIRDQHFSKNRLMKILSKKFQTSFIGALSQFEQNLGYLWGHGKDDDDKTDKEQEFYEIWEKIRNGVLNNGNNQIRAVESELNEYDIIYHGKQYELKKGDNYAS